MSITLSGFEVAKPDSALTATAGSASGDLDQEVVYGYKVTYVTAFGETDTNTADTVTTTTSGSVNLTDIPVSDDGNVTSRKIYRTVGGGATYLLLTTIEDNSTTTYTDTTADVDLGADEAPTLNSAHSRQTISGIVKLNKPPLHSVEVDITAGAGGTSADAYQLSAEYNWISTVTSANDCVKLPELSSNLIGMHVKIRNDAALNAARVYPFDGQTIDGGAADSPITVAADAVVELIATTASNWQQV